MAAKLIVFALLAVGLAKVASAAEAEVSSQMDEPAPAEEVLKQNLLQRLSLISHYKDYEVLGKISDVTARGVADNVRACFDEIEDRSVQIGLWVQAHFHLLMDKVNDGRSLVDGCNSANDLQFAQCFAPKAEQLRDQAAVTLSALQEAAKCGSEGIGQAVNKGVDCVTQNLQSAIPK